MKLSHMLPLIASSCGSSRSALAKLAFISDALHVQRHGAVISNGLYVKAVGGPRARSYYEARRIAVHHGWLLEVESAGPFERYFTLFPAGSSEVKDHFTSDELATMRIIHARLAQLPNIEIYELVTCSDLWRNAIIGDILNIARAGADVPLQRRLDAFL